MMKIYTKTGDKGMTSLIGGGRVAKNSVHLEAYGSVDELNSHIGMIRSFAIDEQIVNELIAIQAHLFDVGGNLATDSTNPNIKVILGVKEKDIVFLEEAIDRMDADLPPMKHFLLPGGNQVVSFCHIARTVCRRAERRIIDLSTDTEIDDLLVKYVNRLSDYLFILSRKISHDLGVEEIKWEPRK